MRLSDLMTFLTADRRRILAGIMLAIACCVPAAAQEARRGFYTPPAAGTVHAVVRSDDVPYSRPAQDTCRHHAGYRVLRAGSRTGGAPRLLHTSRRRHRSCGCPI